MKTRIASTLGLLLIQGLLLASGPAAADEPANAGVWQKQQYSYIHMGVTSDYACDALAAKLKVLLIAAGARADSKAEAGACPAGFARVGKLARAELTFYTLAPAASGKAAGQQPGVWRSVAWSRRTPREIDSGDCELVQQFKIAVLPMFTTRNIVDHTTCIPHQVEGSLINLKFESFAAASMPAA
jgi:hypothetical protein